MEAPNFSGIVIASLILGSVIGLVISAIGYGIYKTFM